MRPLVIGHRGASGTRPENTLESFRRAEELGADMVELDVQRTRDGAVVVMHDFTLERTTNGTGPLRERTLAEVRRLDAGAWFAPAFAGARVPTLAEVLGAIALPVNVELKPVGADGLEAAALAVVESARAVGRVVFSSFDLGVLERLRARAPGAEIAVLWEAGPAASAVACAKRVGARALHVRKDGVDDAMRAMACVHGLALRVWTVNHPAELEQLGLAGVDAIFTDFPERFLQIARVP
ncbi:MAG TPA: glycerophosphodiester phosphodiesterase family protein [Candidatus Binatia bacterium]|nr:glycerophosphodiester phosphodiesterase family protein [Candidatus Binatia bacterium]